MPVKLARLMVNYAEIGEGHHFLLRCVLAHPLLLLLLSHVVNDLPLYIEIGPILVDVLQNKLQPPVESQVQKLLLDFVLVQNGEIKFA